MTTGETNFESPRPDLKLAVKGLRLERALRAFAETKLHMMQAKWKHLVCGSREAKYGSDQSVLRATATRCNSNRFEARKRVKSPHGDSDDEEFLSFVELSFSGSEFRRIVNLLNLQGL